MTVDLPPAELPDLLCGERTSERGGERGGNATFGKRSRSERDLGSVDATFARISSERDLGSVEGLASPRLDWRCTLKELRWAGREFMSALSTPLKLLENDSCSSRGLQKS